LKSLVESLPNADISYAVTDVTNEEEVQAVVDLAVEKYGRVDVMTRKDANGWRISSLLSV